MMTMMIIPEKSKALNLNSGIDIFFKVLPFSTSIYRRGKENLIIFTVKIDTLTQLEDPDILYTYYIHFEQNKWNLSWRKCQKTELKKLNVDLGIEIWQYAAWKTLRTITSSTWKNRHYDCVLWQYWPIIGTTIGMVFSNRRELKRCWWRLGVPIRACDFKQWLFSNRQTQTWMDLSKLIGGYILIAND